MFACIWKILRCVQRVNNNQVICVQFIPPAMLPAPPARTILKAQDCDLGRSMLQQMSVQQDVEVRWTDKKGVTDWWDARVLEIKHNAEGSKGAGVRVGYLTGDRVIDDEEFLNVSVLSSRLRFAASNGQGEQPTRREPPSTGVYVCLGSVCLLPVLSIVCMCVCVCVYKYVCMYTCII